MHSSRHVGIQILTLVIALAAVAACGRSRVESDLPESGRPPAPVTLSEPAEEVVPPKPEPERPSEAAPESTPIEVSPDSAVVPVGEDPIPSSPTHRIDQAMESCQEAANWTTRGVVKCIEEARESWDDEVSAQYDALLKATPDTERRGLRLAQRAWEEYRERESDVIDAVYSPRLGSIWQTISAGSLMDLGRLRALELRDHRQLTSMDSLRRDPVRATAVDKDLADCLTSGSEERLCLDTATAGLRELIATELDRLRDDLDSDTWELVVQAQEAWEAYRLAEARSLEASAARTAADEDWARVHSRVLELYRTRLQALESIQGGD